jgi:hypothetical protein
MSIAESLVFQKEHIQAHAFDAPLVLAEQAVHCLELVAELADTNLNFQFKGGNSLLLVLGKPQRFSIDVDIATDETREAIEASLDKLVLNHKVFIRWTKRQHKTKPWLPIASYYLFFSSHFTDAENAFIMLDVQLRRSPYKTEMKKVTCGELYTSDIKAEVPFPASIIGDKLLTVGPFTLGIPLGKGKEAQRLKHVYDISTLCETKPSIQDIRDSFSGCLAHENSLQEKSISAEDILKDTLNFCGSVMLDSPVPQIRQEMSDTLKENIRGIVPFGDHLFSRNYSWGRLQHDMGRLAICLSAVCRRNVSDESFLNALTATGGDANLFPDTINRLQCDDSVRNQWFMVLSWTGIDIFSEKNPA